MASNTVGTAVIRLSFDGKDVTAELAKIDQQVQKTGKKGGLDWGKAWSTAAGNLISKGASKVASFFTNNFDYAAKRLDTLNKFPIAMKNLGISTEESSAAIKNLSEYTLGLPTTLNDAAEKVQLFAASTGDVNKSVKIFEALNDAVVSGAQSTEVQSTAIYQWSQAIARGSFDVEREYMAMVDANAAAANQIAQSLLGTEADFNDLWEALKSGRVSVDDLLDAMINLDENGTGALQSWHDNARDSAAGIDVAMTRLQTNMGKALAAIIEDTIGWEGLYTAINNIGDGIYKVGVKVGNFLKSIWPGVEAVFNFLMENKWLIGFLAGLAVVIQAVNVATSMSPVTWIILGVGLLIAGLILLTTHLEEVGQWFQSTFGWVGDIINGIGDAIGGLFSTIGKVVGKIASVVGGLIKGIADGVKNVIGTIAGIVTGLVSTIYNVAIAPILNFIKNLAIVVIAIVARLAEAIYNTVIAVVGFVISLVERIKSGISAAVTAIKNIVGAIVGWINNTIITPISNFVNSLINTIKNWVSTAIATIKNVMAPVVNWVNNNVIRPVGSFFSSLWNGVASGVRGAVNGVTGALAGIAGWVNSHVVQPIAGFFSGLWNGVTSGVQAIVGAVQNVMSTIGGLIKAPINGIIGAINGVIASINSLTVPDWVPGIGGAHANFGYIPYLAQGGVVTRETLAVVGEHGAEAVIPLEENTGNWAGLLASTLSEEMDSEQGQRPIQVYITNQINNEMDAADIGRIMMQSIRRAA